MSFTFFSPEKCIVFIIFLGVNGCEQLPVAIHLLSFLPGQELLSIPATEEVLYAAGKMLADIHLASKVSQSREIHPLEPQPNRYCMLASTASAPRVTRCSLGLYWSRDLCTAG